MTRREVLRSLVGAVGSVGLSRTRLAAAGPPEGSRNDLAPAEPFNLRALDPFEIDYGEAAIEDLHRRIDNVRWPAMPFDTGWSSGTSDSVLRELVEYWRNDFDWPSVQERLNELSHLRGPIGGDQLHCVLYPRAGSPVSGDGYPLLLLHGWPGSFHEFGAAAPRLAAGVDGASAFDVIVPSLPGFVFSEAPRERGMDPTRIGERLHALMLELGYSRYGVQGGDWGAIIGTQMARLFPDALVGLHLNFVAGPPPSPAGAEASAAEVAYREARDRFQADQTGYSAIQGTRPQTLGYAQQDSPVGWLAWMLEKYRAWSDHGDDLWDTFSRDDILTTAMLYWLPGRILSAARLYYESRNPIRDARVSGRVQVPTGYARFPAEPWAPPIELVERRYNLVHYSEMPQGGHFPALEQPASWSEDVGRFFSGLEIG